MKPLPSFVFLSIALPAAFGALACSKAVVDPGPLPPSGEVVDVRAVSTKNWGCVVPPFRRAECDPQQTAENESDDCFLLTVVDGAGWDPGVFGGALHVLRGSVDNERMSLPDWYAAQALPAPNGVCADATYQVLHVVEWCTEATPKEFERQYALDGVDDAEYARWVTQTRDAIAANQCSGK